MILAVASRYGVSKVNTETEEVSPLVDVGPSERYMPYGISWNSRRFFIAIRGRPPGEPEFISVYDKDLKPLGNIEDPGGLFRDLHQILWHDGRLWVMSTGYNKVVTVDMGGKFNEWDPNPDVPEGKDSGVRPPRDYNHFNSIYFADSRCNLAAHNFERGAEIWEFTYPDLEFVDIIPYGHQIHNVFKIGGQLYSLDDPRREEMSSGGFLRPPFGYGRGVAINERIYVGMSKFEPSREIRRQRKKADICVYKKDFEFERKISVNMGEIYEVRILDRPDKAHTGVPFL